MEQPVESTAEVPPQKYYLVKLRDHLPDAVYILNQWHLHEY